MSRTVLDALTGNKMKQETLWSKCDVILAIAIIVTPVEFCSLTYRFPFIIIGTYLEIKKSQNKGRKRVYFDIKEKKRYL